LRSHEFLGGPSKAVDVFNSAAQTWSTAQLSVARESLAATSVGTLALIAGGENAGSLLRKVHGSLMNTIAFRSSVFGLYRLFSLDRFIIFHPNHLNFTSGGNSNAVDVYNSATGVWSTAQLSLARRFLAATSVGNLAFFAGGHSGSTLVHHCRGLLMAACV
jgi:hypothetical protein